MPVDGVQDADLWSRLLGLEPPWSVERTEFHLREEKVGVYLVHAAEPSGRVRSAGRSSPPTTTRTRGSGATSTPWRSRLGSTPGLLE